MPKSWSDIGQGHPISVFKTFVFFFAALGCLALLSAPDATHDEMFHTANIWCGRGERAPYCQEIRLDTAFPSALVNFGTATCQREQSAPLVCPTDQSGFSFKSINHGNLYPRMYYFVLSWLVGPSFELSIVLLRLANVSLASILLASLFVQLPAHHRRVMFLMMFVLLPSAGYFLLSSINPSSWSTLGVGFGWLPVHAALNSDGLANRRKFCLFVLGLVLTFMACGSRWDSILFSVVTIGVVLFCALLRRFPNRGLFLALTIACGTAAMVFATRNIVPIHVAPIRLIKVLASYEEGQPDNLSFFSEQVFQSIPNIIQSLGSVPTTSSVALPPVIGMANLVILGCFVARLFERKNRIQIGGSIVALLAVIVSIAAQVDLIDSRDQGGVEPRYSFPLFVFVGGWWFVNASQRGWEGIRETARHAVGLAITLFGATAFFIGERFVDRTSGGLRIISDGPEQWWWKFLPIGPNVVLALSVIFFGVFIQNLRKHALSTYVDH